MIMSIRIGDDGLPGAAAPATSRAEPLARTAGTAKSGAGQSESGPAHVQISSLSETIVAAQPQRAAEVQRLAGVYRSGSYQVDSASLARALVDEALEAGGTK
jgi:anti-sigma28 factor (negative regulator of flagellin synthesis)